MLGVFDIASRLGIYGKKTTGFDQTLYTYGMSEKAHIQKFQHLVQIPKEVQQG